MTADLAAIRARHERAEFEAEGSRYYAGTVGHRPTEGETQCHADRGDLLAEVERLRERERVLREAITAFIAYEATGADQGWLYWDEHFESLRSALAEPKP